MYTEQKIIEIRQELEWALHNLNTIIFKRTDVFPYQENDSIDMELANKEIEKIKEILNYEKA